MIEKLRGKNMADILMMAKRRYRRLFPLRYPFPLEYAERIRSLRNKYQGERCFIIGNGPSLNAFDIKILNNEYTFGVNSIFFKTDDTGFRPTFYVVEDHFVIHDNLKRINAYDCEINFFLANYKGLVKPKPNVILLPADLGFYRENHPYHDTPRFSTECDKVIYNGQTVSYINMQLAYWMGFNPVYLVGMDFSYQIPDSLIKDGINFTSTDDDPNHFHPSYFGKGKRWHDPQLNRVAMNFELAKNVFEKDNRKILNATIGGQLEIFERVDFFSLFS